MPWRAKLRASLIHLALSTLVVGGVLTFVLLLWYPAPYFDAMDAWQVVKLMITVDLVLGPVLTLIVYAPGKRTLALDLSVIAVVQIVALSYASLTLYRERPYFTVFSGDHFEVLARDDVNTDALEDLALAVKPLRGPRLLAAPLPEDPAERTGALAAMFTGEMRSLHFEPAFWAAYEDGMDLLRAELQPVAALTQGGDRIARKVETAVQRHGGDTDALGYIPVHARGRELTALVSHEDGQLVDILAVDPRTFGERTAQER